jgi:hypothetical protein
MKYEKCQARIKVNESTAILLTTRNQTTLNLLNNVKLVISFGIVPLKLLPCIDKIAVRTKKWQATEKNEYIVMTNNQTSLDSLNAVREPMLLGIVPVKRFSSRLNKAVHENGKWKSTN